MQTVGCAQSNFWQFLQEQAVVATVLLGCQLSVGAAGLALLL